MSWIGIDLDGTLAEDNGKFPEIGAPVPAMVLLVKKLLAQGREVRIFTARAAITGRRDVGPEVAKYWPHGELVFVSQQRQAIEAWCEEHLGQALPVTAQKDFDMLHFYDDRAVQVETNTGMVYGTKIT